MSHAVKNQPKYLVEKGNELRRRYRNNLNIPDGVLWEHFKGDQLGVRVRMQAPVKHPEGDMIVDFLIMKKRLVIELGDRDLNRERKLSSLGLKVLWFPREMGLTDPVSVVSSVREAITTKDGAELRQVLPLVPVSPGVHTRNLSVCTKD